MKSSETIRCNRQSLGLSQKKLGEMVGVSAQFIQQLEAGDRKPSLSTALKLAEVLDCTLDVLFAPRT